MSVPRDIEASLKRYVEDRVPPGGFLTAVLANDLYVSFAKADETNSYFLRDIAAYVEGYLPMACRGSYERVRAWLERKENEPREEE